MATGRFLEYMGQGLAADRPVAPDIPADGIALYWSTDTSILEFWEGAAWLPIPLGILTFLGLLDTPDDYTGHGTKLLTVKAAEDGIEFTTAPAAFTTESIQDLVGALIAAGAGITAVYDDGAATLTISSTITQYTDEMVRDIMGIALVAGAGVTVTPDDGLDTITIACTITQYTDEMVRDVIGVALVAGAGITITPNDGADTITIVCTITQYTDEMAQDAVAAMVVDTATIDATYTDGTPELKFDVIQAALKPTEQFVVALSDETTAIANGTGKASWSFGYDFTITEVYIKIGTVSSSGAVTFDVNKAGATIFSTNPSIVAGQKTNLTGGGTAAVISTATSTKGDEFTADIDAAGTGAKGAKVIIIGYRT